MLLAYPLTQSKMTQGCMEEGCHTPAIMPSLRHAGDVQDLEKPIVRALCDAFGLLR